MFVFYLFFSSPSSQAAARTPGGGLRGAPGPACGRSCRRSRLSPRGSTAKRGQENGEKTLGNETMGNEFSLVETPGSRGRLGSGNEAPTPKKAVPTSAPSPPQVLFQPAFFPCCPGPFRFCGTNLLGKSSPNQTPASLAQHQCKPYIFHTSPPHIDTHTLPAAPSYSTTIYFTVYIPH